MAKSKKQSLGFLGKNTRFLYLTIILILSISHFSLYKLKRNESLFLRHQLEKREESSQIIIDTLRNRKDTLRQENKRLKEKLNNLIKVIGTK
ncbi:MAG: hypothetical protein GY858_09010 [Candidatus Omnitrophica bacterium]|nr:hypothetical protein [Candidatus Omnitrophota bacterium]